ncbi:MAG TPA: LolA-related protein [Burkholderiales bacterium]|nr:LolA-related protein [Burkholderiales bacterium]
MRYGILMLALLLPLTAAAQPTDLAAPWSFERMMQQRTQVQIARADFVEVRKFSSGQTQKSSGMLIYRAPGVLERQTATPIIERVVIENDRMTMEMEMNSGHSMRREFPLSRVPAMRPFFVALRSLLSGDTETMQRTFEINVEGDGSAWKIRLVPREKNDEQTRDIVFSGQSNELKTVELRHKNGDSSHTSLTPVAVELKPSSTKPALSRES